MNIKKLTIAGKKIREMILKAEMPWEISREILNSYRELTKKSGKKVLSVAVRSSATAEDLPDASFAGQQETYLNVIGDKELLLAVKKCMASLFTDRAISYRIDKGFDHLEVSLSVCVQEMVRSDIGQSGVIFTLDTESGFDGVVLVSGTHGLGEYVVQGRIIPDQFYVFKEGLCQGHESIISRRLGSKEVKLIYDKNGGTKQAVTDKKDRESFCLKDKDILLLASWAMKIEEHYGHPMDIEWARDGETGKMFIVQARSETVKNLLSKKSVIETYKLKQKGKVLCEGLSI